MTDPDQDPVLGPTAEEEVRRLLADARATGPAPPEVAARLDATLADLTAERLAQQSTQRATPVVSLAARRATRRGRIAGALVAAAAAIVGVAVVAPTLVGDSMINAESDSGADSTAERGAADTEAGASEATESPAPGDEAAPTAPQSGAVTARAPAVRVDRLADDALRLRARADAAFLVELATACPAPVGDAASVLPVELGGQDALLLYAVPTPTGQRVDLYRCPAGDLVRSVELAGP